MKVANFKSMNEQSIVAIEHDGSSNIEKATEPCADLGVCSFAKEISSTTKSIKCDSTSFKTCSGCGNKKIFSEFHSKGSRIDSRCKKCVSIKKKKERRLRKASEIGAKKKRTRMIDLDTSKIYETSHNTLAQSSDHITNLLKDFISELILESGVE